MTAAETLELVEHNQWASARLLTVAGSLAAERFTRVMPDTGSLRDLLVRMMASEAGWLARWRGESAALTPFAAAFPDAARIAERWGPIMRAVHEHFAALDDARLSAPFTYRTRSGRAVTMPLGQSVLHAVGQAGFHRGQVALLLHTAGARGVHTDLATFVAERARAGSR